MDDARDALGVCGGGSDAVNNAMRRFDLSWTGQSMQS